MQDYWRYYQVMSMIARINEYDSMIEHSYENDLKLPSIKENQQIVIDRLVNGIIVD
jgi:hypothetical protein